MTETLTWKCKECGDVMETEPDRHVMEYCECGEAYVDHEEVYIRRSFAAVPYDQDT